MHGNLFALAVLALIVASLAALKVYGKRPDRKAVVAGGVHFIVTFLVLGFLAFGHACDRGGPFGVVAFGALFAGIFRATVEHTTIRRGAWLCWFAIAVWGMELCHCDGYTGNASSRQMRVRRPSDELWLAQDTLRKAAKSGKDVRLPEGWIEDSWRTATGEDFPTPTDCETRTAGYFWHTWFTGVFSLQAEPCGIWCPGGTSSDCSESLEIRPIRPALPANAS